MGNIRSSVAKNEGLNDALRFDEQLILQSMFNRSRLIYQVLLSALSS
jgi:hypothetical protein